MKTQINFKIFVVYYSLFYLFAFTTFLFFFGVEDTLDILYTSPFSDKINGFVLSLGSFLATIVVFIWRQKKLSGCFSYLLHGFYIGNLALLFAVFFNGIGSVLGGNVALTNLFNLISFPFFALLLAYIFGFVFLSLGPSVASAFILWVIVEGCSLIKN